MGTPDGHLESGMRKLGPKLGHSVDIYITNVTHTHAYTHTVGRLQLGKRRIASEDLRNDTTSSGPNAGHTV